MRIRCALLLLLVVVFGTLMAPAAVAQENCLALKALTQATAPADTSQFPAQVMDCPFCVWGGPVWAALGATGRQSMADNLILSGYFFGKDAPNPMTDEIWRKTVGMGNGGTYQFSFGQWAGGVWTETAGFTLRLGLAVWTYGSPGSLGLGYYQATGVLESGRGMFANATGRFTLQGDFIGNPMMGVHWNPELVGNVCLPR